MKNKKKNIYRLLMLKWIDVIMLSTLIILFILLPSGNFTELYKSVYISKFLIFIGACLLIGIILAIRIFLTFTLLIKINLIDIFIAILIAFVTINRFFLQDEYGFSIRYYELLGLSFIYILLRCVEPKFYIYLLISTVIGGIFQATHGILQLYNYLPTNSSYFNISGSYLNPGPYAGYLASIVPISFGLCLFKDKIFSSDQYPGNSSCNTIFVRLIPLILIIGLVAAIMILPSTRSRGAWLAVLISSLFLLYRKYNLVSFVNKWFNSKIKKITASILVFAIILVIMAGLFFYKKESSNGRILIWKVSLNLINDYPLLGIGFDRFKTHYMNYQADYFKSNPHNNRDIMVADNITHAFNEFLEFTCENGILGILLLIPVIILLFRNTKEEKLIIAQGGILSILIFSLFSYPFHIITIKLNLILFIAIVSAATRSPIYSFNISRVSNKGVFFKIGTTVAIIFCSFPVSLFVLDVYNGNKNWKTALESFNSGLYSKSLDEFGKAYPVFLTNGEFLMNYGKILSITEEHHKAIEVLQKSNKYISNTICQIALGDSFKALHKFKYAENAYKNACHMIPNRFYPEYLLVLLYSESNQRKKAIKIARNLMRKDVKVKSVAISEMKAEIKRILKN